MPSAGLICNSTPRKPSALPSSPMSLIGDPESSIFSCGVSPPHDEVLLFRQKDPKPLAPGRGPRVPLSQARLLGLRNSLRSDSPRPQVKFSGLGRSHARRRRDKAFAITVILDPRLDPRLEMSMTGVGDRLLLIGDPVSLPFFPGIMIDGFARTYQICYMHS